MNILLTGANGFVGRVLTHHLLAEGHRVRAPIRSSFDLTHWQAIMPFLFRTASLSQFAKKFEPLWVESLESLANQATYFEDTDVLIHAAAHVHQGSQKTVQAQYQLINHQLTQQLALQAEIAGIKQFIYVSSIKVNGEESEKPFTEDLKPEPSDEYAQSKWDAEQALKQIAQRGKMAISIIRPPLVYGPGVRANFRKLLAYQQQWLPFPIVKPENQRSLCYVENLTAFILYCIANPAAYNETFLIADQEEPLSIQRLNRYLAFFNRKTWATVWLPKWVIYSVATLLNKKPLLTCLYASLRVDCQKAVQHLHWQQPVSQLLGLHMTTRWYQANKERKA